MSTTIGLKYLKVTLLKNHLPIGKVYWVFLIVFSVFRKAMNVEANYFDEFQGKINLASIL
jgi:hypothetical protein